MQRTLAVLWFFVLLILFCWVAYYAAMVTMWSSFILGLFLSLVIMNIFYPPSNTATDQADGWLIAYASIEIIGVIFLFIYIMQKTLCDERPKDCHEITNG
jgi:hypothetical protein